MPQLLLEILSEEIPARMQAKAEADLVKALMDGLTAAGLMPEGIKGFSGPRRLVAVVEGLPVKSADVVEDVIGPKEGAPDAAIQGFLKKAGLSDISQAHVHEVPKKGRVYVAHVRKAGRQTADVIAALVPQIIRGFHWPKSMRWGPNLTNKNGDLRWVRPISRILCTFDGEVVPFEIEGIKSDNLTEGHRVMGRGPYRVRRFDDYADVLKNMGRVILDREERREIILTDAKQLCAAQNLELVDDIGLLEEVAGLAEHPVVIIGDMDASFLDLPPEVIKLSMRTHQKYFAVRDPANGGLAPKFIVVANLDAADGGRKIAEGNSRVLSARLNDARFFWDNDRKVSLESRFEKLGSIVFHEKLGTVKDKAERVMALAKELAPKVGADPAQAERAAKLAKCDLVSDMVGEFAELEGVMGRYYATLQGEPQAIADAVRDHYKPKGPGDEIPSNPVAIAVALADKLDTLVGFWAIGEKPTGSGDPYALRRAALGVIRILLTTKSRINILDAFGLALTQLVRHLPEPKLSAFVTVDKDDDVTENGSQIVERLKASPWAFAFATYLQQQGPDLGKSSALDASDSTIVSLAEICEALQRIQGTVQTIEDRSSGSDLAEMRAVVLPWLSDPQQVLERMTLARAELVTEYGKATGLNLMSFFAERLRIYLRDQGNRYDLIDAVFRVTPSDLVMVMDRVEALGRLLETEDGKNLLAGYRRAANILAIEEKRDGVPYSDAPNPQLFELPEERQLLSALTRALVEAKKALDKEDPSSAMRALSTLRAPVDAFFDNKVIVNTENKDVRANRLRLLSFVRDAVNDIADFSRIENS